MLPLMDSRRRFFKKDKEKKEPSQVIVSFNEKGACKTVSVAVPESAVSKVMKDVTCMCKTSAAQSAENNNLPVKMKDTVVEQNGNIDIKPKGRRFDNYRNNIPDIAHV